MTSKLTAAKARSHLALGFSAPIIGATIAVIFGLVVFDLINQKYQIWIWVIIHILLGLSVVLGTRWSTAAYNFALSKGKKTGVEKGARNLSFVLSILWSAVVIVISLSTQANSINRLITWVPIKVGSPANNFRIEPLTADVIFGDLGASLTLLLVAAFGIYMLLLERGRED